MVPVPNGLDVDLKVEPDCQREGMELDIFKCTV